MPRHSRQKALAVNDCVTASVLHYAAFNPPVDDLCTEMWVADQNYWRPLLEKAEQ